MLRQPSNPAELYAFWRHWLQTPDDVEMKAETREEPHCGFFRARRFLQGYGWHWRPVAIWVESPADPETGELCDDEYFVAKIANAVIKDQNDVADIWLKVKQPVSEEAYRHAMAHGNWSDDKPSRQDPKHKPEPVIVTEQPALF